MFPELFHVGHLTVYSYGVLIGLGTLLAIIWPMDLCVSEGLPRIKLEGLALVIVLSAVIGSQAPDRSRLPRLLFRRLESALGAGDGSRRGLLRRILARYRRVGDLHVANRPAGLESARLYCPGLSTRIGIRTDRLLPGGVLLGYPHSTASGRYVHLRTSTRNHRRTPQCKTSSCTTLRSRSGGSGNFLRSLAEKAQVIRRRGRAGLYALLLLHPLLPGILPRQSPRILLQRSVNVTTDQLADNSDRSILARSTAKAGGQREAERSYYTARARKQESAGPSVLSGAHCCSSPRQYTSTASEEKGDPDD